MQRVEPHGIVPVTFIKTAIIMEFQGTLSLDCGIPEKTSLGSRAIFYMCWALKLGIKHNDMLDRNVIVKNGMVKLIDFLP